MANETRYLFTKKSGNAKTGPIPTVIAGRDSCPPTCPLYNGGCYALIGPMAMHWKRTTDRGIDFDALCHSIAALPENQVWRYATAGDLPGQGNGIDARALTAMVKANAGRRGYTYTHKPMNAKNQKAVANANRKGFTVNLSANHLAQADEYLAMGIAPVCVLIPHGADAPWKQTHTPAGARVVQCPAEYQDATQCANCGGKGGPLCQRSDRNFVIGFTTHGVAKAKAAKVARGLSIIQ